MHATLTNEQVIYEWIVAVMLTPDGSTARPWAAEIVRRGMQEQAAEIVRAYQREEQRRRGQI
jgi:hypothetical protein